MAKRGVPRPPEVLTALLALPQAEGWESPSRAAAPEPPSGSRLDLREKPPEACVTHSHTHASDPDVPGKRSQRRAAGRLLWWRRPSKLCACVNSHRFNSETGMRGTPDIPPSTLCFSDWRAGLKAPPGGHENLHWGGGDWTCVKCKVWGKDCNGSHCKGDPRAGAPSMPKWVFLQGRGKEGWLCGNHRIGLQ